MQEGELLLKLGYEKGHKLQFLNKRICGLWLIWVSIVILISAVLGGTQKIQNVIFDIGYFAGFIFILGNKWIYKQLSFGSPSAFQKKMTTISIICMFVLLFLIAGPYYQTHDYRMIWLGAFLAIGIHFIPFSFVHGKSMIILAILVSINALVGIFNSHIEFIYVAYIDVVIKFIFGIVLLFSKKPKHLLESKGSVNQVKI
jgi:hypothetical protein